MRLAIFNKQEQPKLLSLTFQRDDPIRMMNRTQYSQSSRWTELPHGVAPRFGIDERLLLDAMPFGVGTGLG